MGAFGSLPGTEGIRPHSNQLYVRGLPPDTTDADLLEIFSPFGAIPPRGVKAMQGEGGMCSGIGFIDFVEKDHALTAISHLNGAFTPEGNSLFVCLKNSGRKGKGKGD